MNLEHMFCRFSMLLKTLSIKIFINSIVTELINCLIQRDGPSDTWCQCKTYRLSDIVILSLLFALMNDLELFAWIKCKIDRTNDQHRRYRLLASDILDEKPFWVCFILVLQNCTRFYFTAFRFMLY